MLANVNGIVNVASVGVDLSGKRKAVIVVKISFTTPNHHLQDLLFDQDYHYVSVDQCLRDANYRKWFKRARQQGDYVILANDIKANFERYDIKLEKLKKAADFIFPSEVVIPDNFGDNGLDTIENIGDALKYLKLPFETRLMAIPHGDSVQEYIEVCERIIEDFPQIGCLGLHKGFPSKHRETRNWALCMIRNTDLDIEIHLLGEHADLRALKDAYFHGQVRGINTSKIVNWATYDESVYSTNIPSHRGRRELFTRWRLAPHQMKIARQNIEYWSDYCALG